MPRNFTIKETDIYRMIIGELNDNAFSSVIKFSLADWIYDESNDSMLINKLALTKNEVSRFDVVETYSETTYAQTTNSFVAFQVGPLNGEFTALNTIKDVVYDTTLSFLVWADNFHVHRAITLAIEEVRKRLIQYERILNVEYTDLDNPDSTTKITERLKAIMMSGTIDYGDIVQINGVNYLTYSMPLTIHVTNFGEFANQMYIYLGTSDILEGASTKMFHIEPNEWHWGTARGTESVQLLPDYASPTSTNGKEIKSVIKNKGFAYTLELQLDFQDSTVGELCKWLYKDSMQEDLTEPIMTLTIDFYLYNVSTGVLAKDSSLSMTRNMILTQNQPSESISKGEKLVHTLTLIPIYNS